MLDEEKARDFFVEGFIRSHEKPPREITLDLDATDDALHGNQEGRFFHGYYMNYCYLPLYIFSGDHLLCAKLRPSDIDAAEGAVEELGRIVSLIRKAWPDVKITIRADSGWRSPSRIRGPGSSARRGETSPLCPRPPEEAGANMRAGGGRPRIGGGKVCRRTAGTTPPIPHWQRHPAPRRPGPPRATQDARFALRRPGSRGW